MKRPVRKIRVCAAQYQMRRIASWDEFQHQVDFFVSTAEQYSCHFLLFPELFTVQLFSTLDHVAQITEPLPPWPDDRPLSEDVHRHGKTERPVHHRRHAPGPIRVWHAQRRASVHANRWGVYAGQASRDAKRTRRVRHSPGEGLRRLRYGHARIAMSVCYDIEFPETRPFAHPRRCRSPVRSLQHRRAQGVHARALYQSRLELSKTSFTPCSPAMSAICPRLRIFSSTTARRWFVRQAISHFRPTRLPALRIPTVKPW